MSYDTARRRHSFGIPRRLIIYTDENKINAKSDNDKLITTRPGVEGVPLDTGHVSSCAGDRELHGQDFTSEWNNKRNNDNNKSNLSRDKGEEFVN